VGGRGEKNCTKNSGVNTGGRGGDGLRRRECCEKRSETEKKEERKDARATIRRKIMGRELTVHPTEGKIRSTA